MKKSSNLSKLSITDIPEPLNGEVHRLQDTFSDPSLDLTALSHAGVDSNPNNGIHHQPGAAASKPEAQNSWTPKFVEPTNSDVPTKRIQMLHQLSSLILTPIPFDQLVGFALSIVANAVNGTVASVLELDGETNEFFFRASSGGGSDTLKDVRIPAGEGIVGHVAKARKVELISNANEDERHMGAISRLAGEDLNNCIAAPILVNEGFFGVLEIFNREGGGVFTAEDKETIEIALPVISKVLEVRFFIAEVVK